MPCGIRGERLAKRLLAVLLAVCAALAMPACGKQKTRYTAQFLKLFDTQTEIVAYMDSADRFNKFSQFIYDNLKTYNELYDIYNDYPGVVNVKTINDNAGKAPVKVDRRIISMLETAIDICKKSGGAKNIALGAVTSIWLQYRTAGSADPDNAQLPPMEDLREAAQHVDIDKVVIDEKNSTVYLEDPKMSLDVGSIAKGYATEQVAQLAEKAGYDSALLSVGGNIRAIGDKGIDFHAAWNVGIQNPDLESAQGSLMTVLLKEKSLVTSGVYERYYIVDGKRYHHIIDPTTLFPSTNFLCVSVITENSGLADALTTALFNMNYENGLAFLRKNYPGTEALWVMPDGSMRFSDHFKDYVKPGTILSASSATANSSSR